MKVIVSPHGSYQLDLMFFPKFKKQNRGYSIVMNIIEINSRMAYSIALKTKNMKEVTQGLKHLIHQIKKHTNIPIYKIETDDGSEFLNKDFQTVLKKDNIIHLTFDRDNHTDLAKVERFNGTLRRKINLYQTANNTVVWYDVLDDIVENYNHTEHSSIELKPVDVGYNEEQAIIEDGLERNEILDEDDLEVGDRVRKRLSKGAFKKLGDLEFSRKVYIVLDKVGNQYDIGLKHLVKLSNLKKVGKEDDVEDRDEGVRERTERKHKVERKLKQEGIDEKNIIRGRRGGMNLRKR